jgi:hypothetical protein
MIEELDVVALLIDRADLGLRKGQVGTVVSSYGEGKAFEVEFVDDEGETYAIETFAPEQLLKLYHDVKAA